MFIAVIFQHMPTLLFCTDRLNSIDKILTKYSSHYYLSAKGDSTITSLEGGVSTH